MVFSRNCAILENILGADNVLDDPQSSTEEILQAILDEETYDKDPTSRNEEILIAIANNDECDITVGRSETESILLCVLAKEIYEGTPTSYFAELLQLWSKQVADPDKFAFPFRIRVGHPVEMSEEQSGGE